MSDSFLSRLAPGHSLRSKSSSALETLLSEDSRVVGHVPARLADKKEWAAALLWVDENEPVDEVAVNSLSPSERGTLSKILDLSGRASVSRIVAALQTNDEEPEEAEEEEEGSSFLELVKASDPAEANAITRSSKNVLVRRLDGTPFEVSDEEFHADQIKEIAAMQFWSTQVQTVEDFGRLSSLNRQALFDALGVSRRVPARVQANIAAVSIGLNLAVDGASPTQKLAVEGAGQGPKADSGMSPAQSVPDVLDLTQSLWEQPFQGYGPFNKDLQAREEINTLRRKYLTLKVSPVDLLNKAGVKETYELGKVARSLGAPLVTRQFQIFLSQQAAERARPLGNSAGSQITCTICAFL